MEGLNGPDAEDVAGGKAAAHLRIFSHGARVRGSGSAAEISAGRRSRDFSAGGPPETRRRFVREGVPCRTPAMLDPLAQGLSELTSPLTPLGVRFLCRGPPPSSA